MNSNQREILVNLKASHQKLIASYANPVMDHVIWIN